MCVYTRIDIYCLRLLTDCSVEGKNKKGENKEKGGEREGQRRERKEERGRWEGGSRKRVLVKGRKTRKKSE